MKILFIGMFISFSASTVFACPDFDRQNPDDLTIVKDYIKRLDYISDAKSYNRVINKCLSKNITEASWDQAAILVRSLKPTPYSNQKNRINNRLIKNYLRANFDQTFSNVAVNASVGMSDSSKTNKLLEKYLDRSLKRDTVDFENFVVLVSALQTQRYDQGRFTYSKTKKRMSWKFFDHFYKRMTTEQTIMLARGMNEDRLTNKMIYRYFEANLKNLNWNQVKKLIDGLNNGNRYYNGRWRLARIKDKMTIEWNQRS